MAPGQNQRGVLAGAAKPQLPPVWAEARQARAAGRKGAAGGAGGACACSARAGEGAGHVPLGGSVVEAERLA
jgi:hypothetical protein